MRVKESEMPRQINQTEFDSFDTLLKEAIHFAGGQKGLLQVYHEQEQVLNVVAQVGFSESFLKLFATVRAFDPSACGRALGLKGPIVISDVNHELAFRPFIDVIHAEGFQSVKSIPIFGNDRNIVGVLSVHFIKPQNSFTIADLVPKEHLAKVSRHLAAVRGQLQ